MAESKAKKGKKSVDEFVDDLDAVLGGVATDPQAVDMIDDDEAIDRLLMGDLFEKPEESQSEPGKDDIDRLLEQNGVYERKTSPAEDGFPDDIDDIIAGFDLNPKQQAASMPEILDDMSGPAITNDNLAEAWPESDDEFDEFSEHEQELPEAGNTNNAHTAAAAIDNEQMTEIDEFAELPAGESLDQDDFLMADFNISVDDDVDMSQVAADPIAVDPEQPATLASEVDATSSDDAPAASQEIFGDEFAEDDIDFVLTPAELGSADEQALSMTEPAAVEAEPELVPVPEVFEPAPPAESIQPQVDHSAELAALTAQINELKKLLKQARHEVEAKVDRQEMTACLETVDSLQTEHKKSKRNLEMLLNQKPVGVYVANGVAGIAMLVAVGLWIDSFMTKSQLTQLVEIVGQLKQQVEAAPTADAAEKELLHKQLDDLAVQQTVVNSQLAEFGKALHGEGDGHKTGGDIGKQLSELNNQDMQMGSAIEALQSKVAALEKGKLPAAAPKPVPKKVVVEENWAVNLIAFKQDWYAKRKADEYAANGVAAKVSRTDSKGEVWYRLSVDGFPNQGEAAAYATKVKKTLNLDSVWVARAKD